MDVEAAVRVVDGVAIVDELRRSGVERGDLVGVAMATSTGPAGTAAPLGSGGTIAAGRLGVATASGAFAVVTDDPAAVLTAIDAALAPRWVTWSNRIAVELARRTGRIERCWDLAAVHRLLFGGWRADPASIWARLHDLPVGCTHRPARATPPSRTCSR